MSFKRRCAVLVYQGTLSWHLELLNSLKIPFIFAGSAKWENRGITVNQPPDLRKWCGSAGKLVLKPQGCSGCMGIALKTADFEKFRFWKNLIYSTPEHKNRRVAREFISGISDQGKWYPMPPFYLMTPLYLMPPPVFSAISRRRREKFGDFDHFT